MAQCAVALDGELIKKIPCGYVKIAIETGYLVRWFTQKNSMVDLSSSLCKRLPGRVKGIGMKALESNMAMEATGISS